MYCFFANVSRLYDVRISIIEINGSIIRSGKSFCFLVQFFIGSDAGKAFLLALLFVVARANKCSLRRSSWKI